LNGICYKNEDTFLKVASTNDAAAGLLSKKIDAVSVAAMLCDCGINANNARILFRHLD
jgi:hypothetical protein